MSAPMWWPMIRPYLPAWWTARIDAAAVPKHAAQLKAFWDSAERFTVGRDSIAFVAELQSRTESVSFWIFPVDMPGGERQHSAEDRASRDAALLALAALCLARLSESER